MTIKSKITIEIKISASNAPQILERVKSRRMSVCPLRLNRVAPDTGQSQQSKGFGLQRFLRPDIQISHDVGLAFAPGAGARAAELFERDETLCAVIPFQSEFISDLLNVRQSHLVRLTKENRSANGA